MKKKKVLFLITKSNFGGAQRYVYDLARSLPSHTYSVSVASGGIGILTDKLKEAGVRTLSIESLDRDIHFWSDLVSFREIFTLLRKERPDIIHLNSSKVGGIGACIGRLIGVPRIIFTAHGWAFNEERPIWQKAILWLLSWTTVMLAHKTIAVSNQIKRQMGYIPFVTDKMTVIYNGVEQAGVFTQDEARELLLQNNPKMRDAIPEDAYWVGTVSELHTTKGLSYAIRAIEQTRKTHPNVIFVVIGEGEERRSLLQLVHEHDLDGNVFLPGFIDTAAQYLQAFDIFTLTSISEALSYTILEAGLSRRAVVASNVGGIPEIITSKESGLLVPSRNPQAITNALLTLIGDPKTRDIYGKKLYEKVATDFSLDQMISKTEAVYTP